MERRDDTQTLRVGHAGITELGGLFGREVTVIPYISATDLATTLRAFQRAVYGAAAYRIDPEHAYPLSAEERRAFTLVVTGYEIGSFWSSLTPENIMAAAAVWQAAMMTIQVMQLAASPQEVDSRLLAATIKPIATIVRTSMRIGRRFVASYQNKATDESLSFETSEAGDRRILERAGQSWNAPGIARGEEMMVVEERVIFSYPDGEIMHVDENENLIIVKFHDYTDPIPCRYRPTTQNLSYIHRCGEGGVVTVHGHPERDPWQRPDAPPREITHADISPDRKLLEGGSQSGAHGDPKQ